MNTHFSRYLADVAAIPPLTPELETQLARTAQRGRRGKASQKEKQASLEARTRLVEASLNLVAAVARGFADSQPALEELVFKGNQGLLLAAERFNPNRARGRFVDYARRRIRRAILLAVREAHSHRTPAHGRSSSARRDPTA